MRSRHWLLVLSAAILFAVEISTYDGRDAGARIREAIGAHDLARDRAQGTDFLFDRDFGGFLDRIDRTTPPGRPVRLCMPKTNELYDYDAAYVLAPRPVSRVNPVDFSYRCPAVPAR